MDKTCVMDPPSGSMLKSLLVLGALIFGIAACSEGPNNSKEVIMQESYKVTRGACGEIVLKEKLAENYEKAKKIFEEEEKEYYLSFCPEAPCNEIEIEAYEIEVEDAEGNVPEITFTALRILDKQNGTLLQSVHDVITSNGYLYHINWCPEAPPLIPNE